MIYVIEHDGKEGYHQGGSYPRFVPLNRAEHYSKRATAQAAITRMTVRSYQDADKSKMSIVGMKLEPQEHERYRYSDLIS